MKNKNLLVFFLLFLVSFFWAGSFVVSKITLGEVPPIHLGFLRFLVATPIMVLILFIKNKGKIKHPRKKELISLAILGLTGGTLHYIFQFTGIKYTTASTSAVLISIDVIIIAILSIVFLKEENSIKKTLGIIISFLGVFIIIFAQMKNETIIFDNIFFIGCILIIISALSWAIYSIMSKKLLKKYDIFTVLTYTFVFGLFFFLPFILQDIKEVFNVSSAGWLGVMYLAILSTVFGYAGWNYALKHIEASKAAIFLNFVPLLAIVMSFFYGENITLFFIFGAILIIFGVYLAQKG